MSDAPAHALMKFENIISLGVDCRVRFQISRYFEGKRAMPNKPTEDAGQLPAAILKGTHFFDWNITWFADVIRCLENRFEGLFERETLKPLPEDANVVIDGRYNFRLFHLFHAQAGVPFEDMVAGQYAAVQSKVVYLRDKFLAHLSAANSTIYIRCQAHAEEGQQFCEMMRATYPQHDFQLVIVRMSDETKGFTLIDKNFSVYEMNSFIDKPASAHWTGDDAEWSRLFEAIERSGQTPATSSVVSDRRQATADFEEMQTIKSVGLIGACVAHDTKLALFPNAKSVQIWRVGTVSLMSKASDDLAIKFPDDRTSTRLTLDNDINKKFDLDAVFREKYVIIDFFRDVYATIFLEDGRAITNGIEVNTFGPARLGLTAVDTIEAYDPRFPRLWFDNFQKFSDLANRSKAKFIIVPIYQIPVFWTQDSFVIETDWKARQIVSRNVIFGFMQRIALALLKNSFLFPMSSEMLTLDRAHTFGPAPYHFTRDSYQRAVNILASSPEYVQVLQLAEERRLEIAHLQLEEWLTTVKKNPIFTKTHSNKDILK